MLASVKGFFRRLEKCLPPRLYNWLITAGLLAPVYSIVNKLVNDAHSGWEFDLNRYTLDGCISMTQAGAGADVMMRAVLVGAAFIAVSILLSMAIMKKRDIR